MIDIENKVFDTVFNAVTAFDPNAQVLGETTEEIAHFPTVTINEIANATHKRTLTNENKEHHARVTYEINVFVDNQEDKKAKAKALLNVADEAMLGMRFTRTLMTRLPNVDRTIYRIYARYTAIVSQPVISEKDGIRTETYSIYRS